MSRKVCRPSFALPQPLTAAPPEVPWVPQEESASPKLAWSLQPNPQSVVRFPACSGTSNFPPCPPLPSLLSWAVTADSPVPEALSETDVRGRVLSSFHLGQEPLRDKGWVSQWPPGDWPNQLKLEWGKDTPSCSH